MIMITNQTKQKKLGQGHSQKTGERKDDKPIYTCIFATLYEELKSSQH